MNILLINCPIRLNAKPNCIPYGLATIASVLRNSGFHVDLYDINALRHSEQEIIDTLKTKKWDVAGVSGLITTYSFQKWIINLLKKLDKNTPVVSGGGLVTSNYELLFDNSDLDIGVIGEGEETMPDLINILKTGGSLFQVPGIVFRHNDTIIKNKHRENIKDLDTVPFPAWDLLPMDIYLENQIWGDVSNNSSGFNKDIQVKKSMNIISSRGCPFSCNYCYHLFGKSSYRFRSALNVIEEVEHLVKVYNTDFIGFVDDNMMASKRRIYEFCDLIEEKKLSFNWGCHGRITSAEPAILKRMAETGCVWIGFGIESGSQKILDNMNKRARSEKAKEAIINTRMAGIYPNTTFIFGYPGETKKTVQETIEFKKDMNIKCNSFFITPYPGTRLYDEFKEKIDDELKYIELLNDATKFVINLTNFSDKELFDLKKRQDQNIDVL